MPLTLPILAVLSLLQGPDHASGVPGRGHIPLPAGQGHVSMSPGKDHVSMEHGGITRLDSTQKVVYLVFTGHEFADGGGTIASTLRREGAGASFFFTGDFYRNPRFASLIRRLRRDGHYLGAHSDRHLLYASWENRDSTLVSREEFLHDLRGNYQAMRPFGIGKNDAPWFLPAFEWYNDTISAWTRQEGLALVNFTPGTSSNADYTIPSMGTRYVPADSITARILRYESSRASGLNGFLLLMHIGTHPERIDKLWTRLDGLIGELKRRGYMFRRL